MPTIPPMRPTVVRYGLRAGAILSVAMLATLPLHDRLDNALAMAIGYATMVAAFLLVFAAVRADREAAPGGEVSFRRALAVGTAVVLVGSACYTATWEVLYFGVYRGTFMAHSEARAVEQLRARGASPAVIAAKRVELRRFAALYDNPLANAALTVLEPLPVGLVMAVAAAGVARRRRATHGAPDGASSGTPTGTPTGTPDRTPATPGAPAPARAG